MSGPTNDSDVLRGTTWRVMNSPMPPTLPPAGNPIKIDIDSSDSDTMKVEPVDWLIEDFLLDVGITLVYSNPKAGKSVFALYHALALAEGIGAAGRPGKDPINVLYLGGDAGIRGLNENMKRILTGMGIKQTTKGRVIVSTSTQLDISKEADIKAIQRSVEEYGIELLVIDTIVAYKDPEKSSNDYDAISSIAQSLRFNITEKYGIAVLLLHHANAKGGVMGSEGFKSGTDLIFQMHRPDGGPVTTVKCTGARLGDHPDGFAFQWMDTPLHPGGKAIEFPKAPTIKNKATPGWDKRKRQMEAILGFLIGMPGENGWVSTRTIARVKGVPSNRKTLAAILADMEQDTVVEKREGARGAIEWRMIGVGQVPL